MSTCCTICGAECVGQPQARSLCIRRHSLSMSPPGKPKLRAAAGEFAASCGQYHALIRVERFLDCGTFTPADHTTTSSEELLTTH